MGKYLHTPWIDSQGRLLRWLPVLSALAAESACARDKTGPIDLDCGGGGGGGNMLASLTRWQRVPLSSGARLGPYEIVAPLGSGGMGVVYRGYDLRPNQIVAIKVLGPAPDARRPA